MLRPHGLRGHVVVEAWTNRAERMAAGSALVGGSRRLEVRGATPLPGTSVHERWLVAFAGVDDRESAEALRGTLLEAEPLDDPEALWVHELIGADVVDVDGVVVGRVAAVEANPASDLLVLEDGGLIPLAFVRSFASGRVTAELPPGLLEE